MHNVFKDRDHCSGQLVRAGEKWTLFRRILSQDDVRWLSQALCMENSLQSLDLNGCDIGDEKLSKSHLAKALEVSQTAGFHCVSNVSTSNTIIVLHTLYIL